MRVEELVEQLHPDIGRALIATDFDGTLAPLVPDPSRSALADGALDALVALAGRGAQVAVVTGRAAETVLRLGGLATVPGIVVAGQYGVETWQDGELTAPDTPDEIAALRASLPRALTAAGVHPDVWIEDKRLSLVVHARRVPDPDAELRSVRSAVDAVAAEVGFEVHTGADVLELRPPGFDKAGALRRLVDERRPDAVLFLGDDVGDVPALHEIRRLRDEGLKAWGAVVTSSGVEAAADAADVLLADPAAAVALLRALT